MNIKNIKFDIKIDEIYCALEAEYNLNLFWLDKSGADIESVFIPNAHSINQKFLKILVTFKYLILILWILFGQIFFSVYWFLSEVYFYIKNYHVINESRLNIEYANLYLNTSLNNNLNHFLKFIETPDFKLSDSNKNNYNDEIIPTIYIYKIIGLLGLIWSLIHTNFIFIKLLMNKNKFHLLMYIYTVPRFISFMKALKIIKPKKIFLSNHFDRWNILADLVGNTSVNILQHGSLGQILIGHEKPVIYKPIYKFKNKINFTCYDNSEIEVVKECLKLSHLTVNCFPIRYNFSNVEILKYRFVLLIIGHPLIQSKASKLFAYINKINLSTDICIFYKPHPLEILSSNFNDNFIGNIKIGSKSNEFPYAHAILDYGSSSVKLLINEYPIVKIFMWHEFENFQNVINFEKLRKNIFCGND